MPTMDDFFESKYIKAADLQGREVLARIDRVQAVEMGEERKAVLLFEGKKKGLVLNKTNATKLANAYGQDMGGWSGKETILCPDETSFNGQVVPCIRLRVPQAKREPGDDGPIDW